MSASVDIQTNTKVNILTIPIQAVTTRTNPDTTGSPGEMTDDEFKEVVFAVSGGKAYLKKVQTGIQDNQYIEIVDGLVLEDEIVIAPYSAISRKLDDGTNVEVVDKDQLFQQD
jgi:HlyD family secretion protein